MKRYYSLIVVSLLASASLIFSADFWTQKDYSTWSDEETLKMLQDSPWSKRVRIREDRDNLKRLSNSGGFGGGFGGFGGGMGAPGGRGQGAPAGNRTAPPPVSGPSAPSGDVSSTPASAGGSAAASSGDTGAAPVPSGEGGGAAPGGEGGGTGAPPAPPAPVGGMGGGMGGGFGGFGGGRDLLGGLPLVDVRWQSALPVKQAVMRFNYKDKVKTSEEAQSSINRKETFHILGIIGMPGRKQTYNPEDIKKNSEIIVKKRSIKPAQVLVDQEGDKVSLYLFFAKYNPDGTPLITVDDKEVEISIEAWMYDIKKKFDLKDMVYQGNLDF